jgi:hypothetical protein
VTRRLGKLAGVWRGEQRGALASEVSVLVDGHFGGRVGPTSNRSSLALLVGAVYLGREARCIARVDGDGCWCLPVAAADGV